MKLRISIVVYHLVIECNLDRMPNKWKFKGIRDTVAEEGNAGIRELVVR